MISVIISIYKEINNLEIILNALQKQSYSDFEVIVSEDNNSEKVITFLNEVRPKYTYTIKHASQEDIGFRKTRILNKSLLIADGEYIVFLDGDCIPHYKFLESYHKKLDENTVCLGRRTYLSEKFTNEIKQSKEKDISKYSIFKLLSNISRIENAIYFPLLDKIKHSERLILGCNWGISKKQLLDINGFDEDYQKAGVGEDHDIDWRIRKKGVYFRNIKRSAIVYHLYHKANYNDEITKEVNLMKNKKKELGYIICKNGIEKLD